MFDSFLNFAIQLVCTLQPGKKEKFKMMNSSEYKTINRSKIKVLLVKLLWKLLSSLYGDRFYVLMNFGYAGELLDGSESVSIVVSHFESVLQGKAIAVCSVPPLGMLIHCESAHHAWVGPADRILPGDLAKC